jgi:hypothetical protein
MTIKQIKYALKTDRGVYQTLKRNAIVVGDTSEYAEFDTPLDVQDYIRQRRIAVLKRKDYQDETGALDEDKVADFYVEHYARLESIAVPWEMGLVLKKNDPRPISYGGKIYEVIQGITVNDPGHTPDVTHAHYSEIQAPGAGGYPEWVQKVAPPYYQVGDMVTHNGQDWECIQGDANGNNVWEPGVFGWSVID